MYKQADILLLNFPFTDGSEFKKQPTLIVSIEAAKKITDTFEVSLDYLVGEGVNKFDKK